MTNEVWKPVVGYEGLYEVSNLGRVKSLPRNSTKGRILKLHVNKRNGYVYCSLSANNKSRTIRVHSLVAGAFMGHTQRGFNPNAVVDHIDGNKANNRASNLEIVTQKENDARARRRVKQRTCGIKCIDLETGIVYDSYSDAAKAIGGKKGVMVRRVCDGKRSHYRNHRYARYEDYLNGTIPPFNGKNTRKASESLWR